MKKLFNGKSSLLSLVLVCVLCASLATSSTMAKFREMIALPSVRLTVAVPEKPTGLETQLASGAEFNSALAGSVTTIVFGRYEDYQAGLGAWGTGRDVSAAQDQSVQLFTTDSICYILSEPGTFISHENPEGMFQNLGSLTGLAGLENVDFSTATSMANLFSHCVSLTALDLSGLNTANVTNMSGMFQGCSALQVIYVGSGWSVARVTSSAQMFADCVALVGGNGTAFDGVHIDAFYARIDGGLESVTPGYLSSKDAQAPVPDEEPEAPTEPPEDPDPEDGEPGDEEPDPTEQPPEEPTPTPSPEEEEEPTPTPAPEDEEEPTPTPAPEDEEEPTPTPPPEEEDPTPTPPPAEEPTPAPTAPPADPTPAPTPPPVEPPPAPEEPAPVPPEE